MSDVAAPAANRTLLIVLAAVAGLALLYVFVISPLLVSDPTAEDLVAPAPTGVPGEDPLATPAPELGEPDDAPLPETFEVFNARDPFQQLVTAPVEVADAGDGDGDGTTAEGGTPGTDGTAADGTPGTGGTPAAGTPGTGAPGTPTDPGGVPATRVGATVVRLVTIADTADRGTRASITVNGQGFDVGEGETFATSFRVLDISGSCATLLFGDSRFTLCTGEEIRK